MFSRWVEGAKITTVLRLIAVVASLVSLVSVSSCSLLFDEVGAGAGSQPDGGGPISPEQLCGNGLLEGVIDQFIVDNNVDDNQLENSISDENEARLYLYSGDNEEETVLVTVPSLSKCGLAMDISLDGEAGRYARVEHDAKYNTLPFSADFWFSAKSRPPKQGYGLLTKDQRNFGAGGHVSIYLAVGNDGRTHVVLRTQNKESEAFICTEPITVLNTWHHVALSIESDFAKMYIDGKETFYEGTVQVLGSVHDCSSQTADMFPSLFASSNQNDWIWGASNDLDKGNNKVTKSFDGYLDHLRFRTLPMTQELANTIYTVLTVE